MSGAAVFACRCCGVDKPRTAEFFHQKRGNADGLNKDCIVCRASQNKLRKAKDPDAYAERNRSAQARYRSNHREKVLAKGRLQNAAYRAKKPEAIRRAVARYQQRHPEKCREVARRWRLENSERVRELSRRWTKANPEKVKARADRWRRKNLTADAAKSRLWRRENPAQAKASKAKQYRAMKAEAGPSWIRMRVSNLVKAHVRNRLGGGKSRRSWSELVGYSEDQFIKHIERQFARGMSWENWGSLWHLDHIIPVSSFDVRAIGDAEFLACWALPNLRPLPARENLSKAAKRLHLI